jgi:predicted small metal-binding protein
MRVIECDVCGELISAANDDELRRAVKAHYEATHADAVPSDERIDEIVAGAYDAMDS